MQTRRRPEAQTGLQRASVAALERARLCRALASAHQALEAEERWDGRITMSTRRHSRSIPSLVFAQQGTRSRGVSRSNCPSRLQALIDRPERLCSRSRARSEAESLDRSGRPAPIRAGLVLRSQIAADCRSCYPIRRPRAARSWSRTTPPRCRSSGWARFGTFSKREIELKPGKYTVVGTRPGFRDVRRDVTIAPGRDVQTISVSLRRNPI